MTISFSLPPETEAELRRRAAALGKNPDDFARQALEEKLAIPETFAQVLSPIHEATRAAGGVDEAELDDHVEKSRDELQQEKNRRRSA